MRRNAKPAKDDDSGFLLSFCLLGLIIIFVAGVIHSSFFIKEEDSCYTYQCNASDLQWNCAVKNAVCDYCIRLAENQCINEE